MPMRAHSQASPIIAKPVMLTYRVTVYGSNGITLILISYSISLKSLKVSLVTPIFFNNCRMMISLSIFIFCIIKEVVGTSTEPSFACITCLEFN